MAELASAVVAGVSLLGTSVEQISKSIDTDRNVTIEITNCTDTYVLSSPKTYFNRGHCNTPPQPTIAKRTKEVCAFSKTAYTTSGSSGVLMYHILNDERKCVADMAIMFSLHYEYKLNPNRFALGIYPAYTACDGDLFSNMYKGHNGRFTRGDGTGAAVECSDGSFTLRGTMSDFGQAIIKAEFTEDHDIYIKI